MSKIYTRTRNTKETTITMNLNFEHGDLTLDNPVPFFSHVLYSMLFHGGWSGSLALSGDIEVDDHHLVEDTGIVLGEILALCASERQPIQRFGTALVPMDDALARVAIDFSGRPYLAYEASYPQARVGTFDVSLIREFFYALAMNAHINLHIALLSGINAHHMIEASAKACGLAIKSALQSHGSGWVQSTKGLL